MPTIFKKPIKDGQLQSDLDAGDQQIVDIHELGIGSGEPTHAIHIDPSGAPTAQARGIAIGSDIVLYRSAASTLSLLGNLAISGNITAGSGLGGGGGGGTITANRAAVSDGAGNIIAASVTDTELGYLSGVTSALQTQLAAKAPLASPTFTGAPTLPTGTIATTQAPGDSTTALATTAFVAAATAGLLDLKGSFSGSGNPSYPAASKGDVYVCSVAGKIGGLSGKTIAIGDFIVAGADNAGGDEASVGTSWYVLETNQIIGTTIQAWNTMLDKFSAVASTVISTTTMNLDSVAGSVFTITGTTTVTGITLTNGRWAIGRITSGPVQFSNNGGSCAVLGGSNYVALNGDVMLFIGEASSRVNVIPLYQMGRSEQSIAGAATINLDAFPSGTIVSISGTAFISTVVLGNGKWILGRFQSTGGQLLYNATTLAVSPGINIAIRAGDQVLFTGRNGVVSAIPFLDYPQGGNAVGQASSVLVSTAMLRDACVRTDISGSIKNIVERWYHSYQIGNQVTLPIRNLGGWVGGTSFLLRLPQHDFEVRRINITFDEVAAPAISGSTTWDAALHIYGPDGVEVFSIDVSGSVVNSGPSVQVYTTLTPGHVVIPAYHKVTLVITSVTPPYGGGGDLSGGVIWIEGNWVT